MIKETNVCQLKFSFMTLSSRAFSAGFGAYPWALGPIEKLFFVPEAFGVYKARRSMPRCLAATISCILSI